MVEAEVLASVSIAGVQTGVCWCVNKGLTEGCDVGIADMRLMRAPMSQMFLYFFLLSSFSIRYQRFPIASVNTNKNCNTNTT